MTKQKDTTKKIQFFSEETRRLYQLYGDPPTLKISGVPMHRHVRMTPLQDTETKIKAAVPKGKVLDTCTGLGYTAIYSSRIPQVRQVITVERDPNVLEMARINPYSKELFGNGRIEINNGDTLEVIRSFNDHEFDTIIHDPPTFSIAPDLYTLKFHQQLFRVLKKGGRLWHYAPEPGKMIMQQGSKLKERILKQLKEVGFINVRLDENSSGIIAEK